MTRQCDASGCSRPHHAKGLCQSHYKRGKHAEVSVHRFADRPEFVEAERLLGLGLTYREVAILVGTDRWTLARNFPERSGKSARNSRYYELLPLVRQGVSLNEIQRTIGMDYRTVRRYFPHYKPFEVGGAGRASSLRKANHIIDNAELKGTK